MPTRHVGIHRHRHNNFSGTILSKEERCNEVHCMRGTNPSDNARPQHRELHGTLFVKSVWVSLLSPVHHITLKMQETGPMVYSPYLRRLEYLF